MGGGGLSAEDGFNGMGRLWVEAAGRVLLLIQKGNWSSWQHNSGGAKEQKRFQSAGTFHPLLATIVSQANTSYVANSFKEK